jgi:hypothetical protein
VSPRTGRPPRGGVTATERVTVWLTEAELAEIEDGRRDPETVSDVLRDGGLKLVRERRT